MVKNNLHQLLLILKVLLVICIAVSPFIKFTYIAFVDTLAFKIAFVILIICTCFVDFQLSLLLMIALLITIINIHASILRPLRRNTDQPMVPEQTMVPLSVPDKSYENFDKKNENDDSLSVYFNRQDLPEVQDASHNVVCAGNAPTSQINESMLSMFIDDKIKPYDVYISMMTSEEQLAKAQGSIL